jgi:peptide/nickel transport system ATP-binding protein
VTLAMAFACRPALVILDQPSTSLDVNVQKKVLSTVRELCERYRAGAIYLSHDLAVVTSISDWIAVIYQAY